MCQETNHCKTEDVRRKGKAHSFHVKLRVQQGHCRVSLWGHMGLTCIKGHVQELTASEAQDTVCCEPATSQSETLKGQSDE